MLVSVIIPVFNREYSIRQCLESVLSQDFKGDYEVIVVDDASTDNTKLVLSGLHDPKLEVIYNEQNHGPSYARNRGIQHSKGQYIAFMDSDCIADKKWIEEIIKPFDLNFTTMITSGKTTGLSSNNYWEMINERQNFISSKDGYVRESHSGNMAVRGSFIRENLFDETLLFSEDLDLCLRCLRKNYKIYYSEKARMLHAHRSTFASTVRSHFRWGTYNAFTRLKWKIFPFLNYGTFIFLGFVVSLLGHFEETAKALFFVYLALILYIGIRPGVKDYIKVIRSYPGWFLLSLINCLGNLRGLVLFVLSQWKGG